MTALLGLATGAAAQDTSSVVIYGLVDLSAQYLRSGDRSALRGDSFKRLSDGTAFGPGSRLGFRITEALGGGLKAGALLEQGINADTGNLAQGGRAFGRQAFVWLSSATVGEVRMGRQYALHDEVQLTLNPSTNTLPLNPGALYTLPTGGLPQFIDAPRIDNAMQYITPSFGGLRLQAMVALGEGSQDRYQGVKAAYGGGPLTLAASYEQSKAFLRPAGAPATVNKILEVGGNYDFGAFRLFGGYQKGDDLTTGIGTQIGTLTLPGMTRVANGIEAATVGASTRLGSTTLMANYTQSRYSNALGQDVSVGRAAFAAVYGFSRTASMYGAVSVSTGDLKDYLNEKQLLQIGLRKAF